MRWFLAWFDRIDALLGVPFEPSPPPAKTEPSPGAVAGAQCSTEPEKPAPEIDREVYPFW